MKVLDLFSGIGGFSLGLERAGFETVAFCEVDKKAQLVLKKHWPNVPIFNDVKTLTKETLENEIGQQNIGLICGGFPCQDISTAGKGIGIIGERSGLWSEYRRLISEIRPQWAIIENVSALRSKGLTLVLQNLSEIGYDAEWHCIPASAVGAPHQRDRIWIIAHPTRAANQRCPQYDETCRMPPVYANTKCGERKMEVLLGGTWWERESAKARGYWETENSPVGMGVHDGIPNRMDRLKQLGNSVVPQIPEIIGRAIMEREQQYANAW